MVRLREKEREENLRLREKEREEYEKKFRDMESHMNNISGIEMPSSAGLPSAQSNNPWFIGHFVTRTDDDYFNMAYMGIRHIDDIVFWPDYEAFPKCYLRLADDVVEKDDRVSDETILYPYRKAQESFRRIIRTEGAVSTHVGIGEKKTSSYLAPKEMVFPFTSKVLSHCNKNWKEKKAKPDLKEFDRVSLLIPQESDQWNDCHMTFKSKKLEREVAQTQLGENLPLLPHNLLKTEYESRLHLSDMLSLSTQAELLLSLNSLKGDERKGGKTETNGLLIKIHAKSIAGPLNNAIWAFGEARKACRRFVLKGATIRFEPDKLIDSSIWGEFLFPEGIVTEVKENAAKIGKSLADRWGITPFQKRKAEGDQKPIKKFKTIHSPANNPKYDNSGDSSFQYRRQRGRSPRGRGIHRGNQYRGSRGYRGGRGRGGHGGNPPPGPSGFSHQQQGATFLKPKQE